MLRISGYDLTIVEMVIFYLYRQEKGSDTGHITISIYQIVQPLLRTLKWDIFIYISDNIAASRNSKRKLTEAASRNSKRKLTKAPTTAIAVPRLKRRGASSLLAALALLPLARTLLLLRSGGGN